MDQYVVYCYCDPDDEPVDVGYIDDNRANGGRLELDAWRPQPTATLVKPTRPGHRRTAQVLVCRRCGRKVRLSDTTAAEIVDLISRRAPDGGKSPRDLWGKTVIPFEVYVDSQARSDEVLEEMLGDRDPLRPSDVPTVMRYAHVYVIPFIELRRMVSARDKRRD
jgi:hypothetical protein